MLKNSVKACRNAVYEVKWEISAYQEIPDMNDKILAAVFLGLRVYPNNPEQRNVIMAQTK